MPVHVYVDTSNEKTTFINVDMPIDWRVKLGTLWSDTLALLHKRCTSVSPITFVSTEGGGGGAGVVPIGGIIMWSGTIATIPASWALCNGTDNAPGPDLRDKFVVGARQDDGGVAKTNIEGALSQSGGATGHSHSGHGNLSHTGVTIGDHTGLTHGLSIANHPDLTHIALSHPATTLTHPDHSVPSFTGSHASAANISAPSGSIASHAAGSMPSLTHTHASGTHTHASTAGVSSFATSTNRSGIVSVQSHTGSQASLTGSDASRADLSGPSRTWPSRVDLSGPSGTHTHASLALAHGDHSFPSLSHQAIGTHLSTDYGVHTFTTPPAHGAAGTLTHSFSQPNDHSVSAHDTVLQLPNYFALAFIQRMS